MATKYFQWHSHCVSDLNTSPLGQLRCNIATFSTNARCCHVLVIICQLLPCTKFQFVIVIQIVRHLLELRVMHLVLLDIPQLLELYTI